MASKDQNEAARILLRMNEILEKSQGLMTNFKEYLGPMVIQIFETIAASIDVKSRIKKNQEFESEFDKLRFYNQKHC